MAFSKLAVLKFIGLWPDFTWNFLLVLSALSRQSLKCRLRELSQESNPALVPAGPTLVPVSPSVG